jgi:hypothetical protein
MEASPTVLTSSDDDTDPTKSDGEYDSEPDPDVNMCTQDDVDTPDSVNLGGDVDMEWDSDDAEEKDEEKEDEDKEENKDEDEGKKPPTIGQGKMPNTVADDVDTMVDNQPIVLPEQGQEISEHTPQPQPPAPTPRPQTTEPRPPLQNLETYPFSGLEHMVVVTPQKPHLAVPTLQENKTAGNTSDVDMDVDLQLLSKLPGDDILHEVPSPDFPFPHVPLLDSPPPAACPVGSVGKE